MSERKIRYKDDRYVRVRKKINGVFKDFYGTSKRDAERKRDEYVLLVKQGINPDLANNPLYNTIDEWLRIIEKNGLKDSTYKRYAGILELYICFDGHKPKEGEGKDSPIKNIAVGEIRKITLQKYYNDLATKGKSYSQIQSINKLLHKFFKYALEEGYVLRNPCSGIKNPVEKVESETEIFTDDELTKMRAALNDHRLECFIKLLLSTGMRLGEILALNWSDIDLEKQTIKVNKSFNNAGKITTPKTKSSNRVFVYPKQLNEDLARQRIQNAKEKLAAGYEKTDLVFPSELGNHMNQRNVRLSYERMMKAAGVKYRNLHTLRHTFTSKMRRAGYSLELIAEILGHSSILTTGDIYSHATIDDMKKAVNSVSLF